MADTKKPDNHQPPKGSSGGSDAGSGTPFNTTEPDSPQINPELLEQLQGSSEPTIPPHIQKELDILAQDTLTLDQTIEILIDEVNTRIDNELPASTRLEALKGAVALHSRRTGCDINKTTRDAVTATASHFLKWLGEK